MTIPLVDLAAQYAEVATEVEAGLAEVFATSAFIGGKAVAEFETAYAIATDVAHCIGVANGTDALELALRGVGVRPDGEVILPANTFIATAEAVSRIGAIPVLVDVDPEYLLIDPVKVSATVTPRTQAIIPVHLFGQVAPVELVREIAQAHHIAVVEDAAQSQGATRLGRHGWESWRCGRHQLLSWQKSWSCWGCRSRHDTGCRNRRPDQANRQPRLNSQVRPRCYRPEFSSGHRSSCRTQCQAPAIGGVEPAAAGRSGALWRASRRPTKRATSAIHGRQRRCLASLRDSLGKT